MRLIILLAILFSASLAEAKRCYLVPCAGKSDKLCAIGKSYRPKDAVCRVKCRYESQDVRGAFIDPIIVTLDPEGAITSEQPWSEGAEIGQNQRIECRKDQAAIDAAKAAQATERSQRQARRAKRRKLRQDFVQWCIEEFSSRRGKGKEFNTCLSALFKKVFADDQFVDLPEDALESKGGG